MNRRYRILLSLLLPLVVVMLPSAPSRQSTNRSAAARGLSFPTARGVSRRLVTSCRTRRRTTSAKKKEFRKSDQKDDHATHHPPAVVTFLVCVFQNGYIAREGRLVVRNKLRREEGYVLQKKKQFFVPSFIVRRQLTPTQQPYLSQRNNNLALSPGSQTGELPPSRYLSPTRDMGVSPS